MKIILPPGVNEAAFQKALDAFAGVVGKDYVLSSDADRETYMDVYAPAAEETQHLPAGAVAPSSVEEVQAILRLANEHRIPLWPISRGKNLGYGGSAPRMSGTVMLDLMRMNRILDVNERYGYCLVEPGVGFFDLYDHLQRNRIPLWMSVPGNAWGSVAGNALERGFGGYTPNGDHSGQICGLEVVLPNGALVRTGMGAMANSATWQLFKYGYGPAWDQLFVQSNFGVVTKLGLWLMPEPEATLSLKMELPNAEDIGWAIDVLAPLKLRRIVQNNPSIGNYLRVASVLTQRSEWYQGDGPMPESAIEAIRQKYDLGWWGVSLYLYGHDEVNEANAKIIRDAFAKHTAQEFKVSKWKKGDPVDANSGAGVPSAFALQTVNWRGGRGGHIGFSPILPPNGDLALKQFRSSRQRFEQYGLDYYGSFTLFERHISHINILVYDRDDPKMSRNVRDLFRLLIADAREDGYGEYRTHLGFMDDVADTFDFNGHALLRLNEKVKKALDPNGILAPGKQGIWPENYRGRRE